MDAFKAFSPDGCIYTTVVNEGDALACPPGFMFTDMTSHSGVCGIMVVYVHRGMKDKLQSFYDQQTLYCKDPDDPVLGAVLQDVFFVCDFGDALACRRLLYGSHR